MPRQIKKASTDVTLYFFIQDSSDGSPETGVTITNLDLQYVRFGAAPSAKVDATALAATDSAHADNKAIEVDGTDQPGLYRVDWPDAAFASGVDGVVLTVKGTGFHPAHMEIQLVDYDPTDAVRLGLTALPNAAADAAGGLPISDAGGLDLDAMNTNIDDIETDTNELQTDWTNAGRLDAILDTIAADVVNIDGDAMRGTDGANTTVPDAAGTAPTAAAVVNEFETQSQADPTGFHVNVKEVNGTAQTANDNGADINAILTDTNELQADWANAGRLDAILDTIAADVVNIDGDAMRGTDSAALASVLGALADAAAAGDPTEADTLMQYVKQLINVLIGAAGIGTFPAEAAPANAVSLAEVIRAIHVDVTGLNGDAMRGTDSSATASALSTHDGKLDTVDNFIDTEVAAIKTVTDNLPNSGALTDIDTGVNNIEAKLPTNYIMGSSDQTDKDDEIDAILADTGTDGVVLADNAITSGKYDESTAFPVKSADTGATQIARVGADSDTLETLSDQLDTVATPAQVNAEVLDVLTVDTFAEPGQEAPAATNTLAVKIGYMFKAWRNKVTQTATTLTLLNDDGTTEGQTATVSDDGTTFTRGEMASGS